MTGWLQLKYRMLLPQTPDYEYVFIGHYRALPDVYGPLLLNSMLWINRSHRVTTAVAFDNFFFTEAGPQPRGTWQPPVFQKSCESGLFDNCHHLQEFIERCETTCGHGSDPADEAGTDNGVGGSKMMEAIIRNANITDNSNKLTPGDGLKLIGTVNKDIKSTLSRIISGTFK